VVLCRQTQSSQSSRGPTTKNEHSEAKKQFAEEKKQANWKAFGQPVNPKMDDVLKKNGID
jgi:hypothetical protein